MTLTKTFWKWLQIADDFLLRALPLLNDKRLEDFLYPPLSGMPVKKQNQFVTGNQFPDIKEPPGSNLYRPQ